jgi:hypothetical protein
MNYRLYNDALCPDLWDKKGDDAYKLKPEVRKHLLQLTKDVNEEKLKEEGVKVKFEDVVIVGSSTNYNWTAYSDIDVHVLVDYSKMDLPEKEAIVMLNGVKSNWNKTHDIKIKGHDVELNFTDIDKKGSVSSIYSLKSNKWLEPPVKDKPNFNKELIKSKHAELKAVIDKLLKDSSSEDLDRVLEKLYFMRQAGLDRRGEMSEENIIFKILRAQGYVDKLKEKVVQLYDKEMTLKESLFDHPETRYKPEDKAEFVAATAMAKATAEKLGKPYNDVIDGTEDHEDNSMVGEIAENPMTTNPSYKEAVFKLAFVVNTFIDRYGHYPTDFSKWVQRVSETFHADKEDVAKHLTGTMEFLRDLKPGEEDDPGGKTV